MANLEPINTTIYLKMKEPQQKTKKVFMPRTAKAVYIILIILCLFPFDKLGLKQYITPAVALFLGLIYAMIFACPYPTFNKKTSKYLLQVICCGARIRHERYRIAEIRQRRHDVYRSICFRSNGHRHNSRLVDAPQPQDGISYFVRHRDLRRQRHSRSRTGSQGEQQ